MKATTGNSMTRTSRMEGTSLSGSKSLPEDPPEDETSSKKLKKPKSRKASKGGNKGENHE